MNHASWAQAPSGIVTSMTDYFDALHTQDMDVFDRVFHPQCVLYGVVDGELNVRILLFDQISDTAAMVKPQLQMFGGVMQDYLSLSHLDGSWWVVAKLWEKVRDV